MKRYQKARTISKARFGERASSALNTWTKIQGWIALFSVIIAAIGVSVSAISTYLTYRQLQLLARERSTPYRAILFSSKLDSYKAILRILTKYNYNSFSVTKYQDVVEIDSRFRIAASQVKQNSELAHRNISEFTNQIREQKGVWPSHIQVLIDELVEKRSELQLCESVYVSYAYGKMSNTIFDEYDCNKPVYNKDADEFYSDRLVRELLSNIQANRLHEIS